MIFIEFEILLNNNFCIKKVCEMDDFILDWKHFFIYGIIWFVLYALYLNITGPVVELSNGNLKCLYNTLLIEADLTEEQEKQMIKYCGEDPCKDFSGCSLDETKENPCEEFDECYYGPEKEKYTECYDKNLGKVVTLSSLMDMSSDDLQRSVIFCGDE